MNETASTRTLLVPGAAWLAVTLLAFAAGRGHTLAAAATPLACVLLPMWLASQGAIARTIHLQRPGWIPAATLAVLVIVLPFVGLFLFVRGVLGGLMLLPPLDIWTLPLLRQAPFVAALAWSEEVFFRGFLQEWAGRGRWRDSRLGPVTVKNLLASILFGAAHAVALSSPLGLSAVASGLVLGWLVERSRGSIWPATLVHAVANVALAWHARLIALNLPGPLAALIANTLASSATP